MSKIRTLNDLDDRLSEDLVWRKKELSSLKALIETKSFEPSKRKVLIRGGVSILYAHWEGFIKYAATAYLEFVAAQKQYRYCDLAYNFVAVAMKSKLNQASDTNKSTIHNEVLEFLVDQMEQRINIPTDNVIITASNLSSRILEQILALLGIDSRPYETKKILIDEKLLAKRNMIAHGEFLDVNIESYQELHKEVIDMMDLFRDQIENHAGERFYLRPKK